MERWICHNCKYPNPHSMRNCVKRCGTKRPEIAKPLPPIRPRGSERPKEVAEKSPLMKALIAVQEEIVC